jgi:hypothetical protein
VSNGLLSATSALTSQQQHYSPRNTEFTKFRANTSPHPRVLPLTLAISLLLAWVLACAALFAWLQHWTFADAAYFFFISLTTIGMFLPSN